MTDSRDIALAGRTFNVSALPLRVNMAVYPICRKLTAAGLIDRCVQASGALDCSADEMAEISDAVFMSVNAAGEVITREEFDGLPITPPELLDAFFAVRYLTGAWVPVDPSKGVPEGEG